MVVVEVELPGVGALVVVAGRPVEPPSEVVVLLSGSVVVLLDAGGSEPLVPPGDVPDVPLGPPGPPELPEPELGGTPLVPVVPVGAEPGPPVPGTKAKLETWLPAACDRAYSGISVRRGAPPSARAVTMAATWPMGAGSKPPRSAWRS